MDGFFSYPLSDLVFGLSETKSTDPNVKCKKPS